MMSFTTLMGINIATGKDAFTGKNKCRECGKMIEDKYVLCSYCQKRQDKKRGRR